MNLIPKIAGFTAITCLSAQMLWAGLNTNSSTATMKVYETGAEKLTVYTDVPGHTNSVINGYPSRAKSDIYEIRVRSAATDNVWVQCFANMTYNRGLEMPELVDFQTGTSTHAYQRHTKGWTHTYANIEMSTNSPIEVEIRKIGTTLLNSSNVIFKSAVHPAQKISSHSNHLGRVYFTLTNPGQVVIDINGQMDDHSAAFPSGTPGGAMPGNPPVHSVALYANPIMAKPVAGPTNTIVTVTPNLSSPTNLFYSPDPATYDTLVFAPGVHYINPGFKVHPGKSYYIPGDAILYGSLSNDDVPQGSYRCEGDRINIYGYGTICCILIPHYQNKTHDDTTNGIPNPEYPEFFAWPEPKAGEVGIAIRQAWDAKITGVTIADPANFNTRFDGYGQRVNDQGLVSWVKLHSWRVNGDGFGGYSKVEDSFIRASDDSTYVRDWRRRCTFWKDSNASMFRNIWDSSGGAEDCDILYARWRATSGVGNVFNFVAFSDGESPVLTFRNIRYHDKLSNPRLIIAFDNADYAFTNVTFENIAFYTPLNNQKSEILGSAAGRYGGRVMFTNITFQNGLDGSAPVRLTRANYTNYFAMNEFVDSSIFEPPPGYFTLTTNAVNGSITLNPAGITHATGTVVTVTAVANSGYTFANWSGDLAGAVNPTTITMNGNKIVTANFNAAPGAVPWVEDFQSQATGATSDGPPTAWTATPATGSFRVLTNEMAFNNVGTDGVFTTGVINISSGPVTVSLQVRGGSGSDVGQDFLRLYKKVDGGAEVQIAAADGPQAPATWTGNVTAGSNLVLVIRAHVTATSEYYYFDDLIITNIPAISPSVSITQPASNAVFASGANLLLTANASDPDGTVSKVEYFIAGTTKIGQSTSGPTFSFTWTNAPAGRHNLTAIATDNVGATGVSVAVPITIRTWLQSSSQVGGQVQIQWAGGGTLQTAANVVGPWSDVPRGSQSLPATNDQLRAILPREAVKTTRQKRPQRQI